MSNKTSPHGGFITVGTISHGTHRPQDLLRSFAAELERIHPFNTSEIVSEAREAADVLDGQEYSPEESDQAEVILEGLRERLEACAEREGRGLYFGTTEGDGSDFGFWEIPADELCD